MSERTDRATGAETDVSKTVRRRAFVAGAGASLVGAGVASGEVGTDTTTDGGGHGPPTTDGTPRIVAHRGYAGMAPENTVGAVTAASKGGRSPQAPAQGADSIEIDVLPTADGDVVVFHDDRLSSRDGGERGLTDTDGVVWEESTETVTSAKVLGTEETVPLMTEVFDAIPPSVGVNIEMKNPGSFDLAFAANLSGSELAAQTAIWHDFVVDVLNIADQYNNDILVSSFYEAALAVTREVSDYDVAPLLWDSIEDGLEIAREYDAEAVNPPYNMIEGTPFFADPYYTEGPWEDVDLLQTAHDEGRAVNVYTLATWYEAERLAAAGVDGLICDYPGLLRFGATQS
ncbi:glycerophosphodiester phosphodiesterase [Salinirubrum litoreum]|uniref:Glycerophosphodiester phosphodiesterase n=1 Tax=Salinirubrum litoreum TaxID=1126234 RepID=A0ABD5RB66_9EURY|nr:glycerophosphodiester phosphodiesterase [Salinirubrum litoreum]